MAERQMTLNLAALAGQLQISIQRASDMAAFGLTAAREMQDADFALPDTGLVKLVYRPTSRSVAEVREDFEMWLTTAALQECIRALGSFLVEARRALAAMKLMSAAERIGQGRRIKADAWNNAVLGSDERFASRPLPDKLDYLRREYDEAVVSDIATEILTINKARNCLEHREGVVRKRDCNDGERLTVRWRRMRALFEGREVHQGDVLDGGEGGKPLSIEIAADGERSFDLGTRVEFIAQEFSEICWTFVLFGQSTTNGISDYGVRLGIIPEAEPGASR